MKKLIFGMMLFVIGATAFLVMRIYLGMNPHDYNGITGLQGALLGNNLLYPYRIFCGMGIIGFIICLYQAFIKK